MTTTVIPAEILSRINTVKDYQKAAEKHEAEYEAQESKITLKSQDEIERDWIIATIQSSPLGHALYKAVALLLSELSDLHQDDEY